VYVTDDSVNGEVFLVFVRNGMLPIVMPLTLTLVVMENASIHHVDELLTSVGVLVKFFPLYFPDINLIEEVFVEFKHHLQANNRSFGPLMTSTIVVLESFNSVCKENCQWYIKIQNTHKFMYHT